jgi:hypothetical protein
MFLLKFPGNLLVTSTLEKQFLIKVADFGNEKIFIGS